MSGQGSHFARNNNDEPVTGNESRTAGTVGSTTSSQTEPESSAVIGSTTTYSSRPLASGDPLGSVIDHESKDPMTYRRPEHYHSEAAETTTTGGVPSGAATIAASKAFGKLQLDLASWHKANIIQNPRCLANFRATRTPT